MNNGLSDKEAIDALNDMKRSDGWRLVSAALTDLMGDLTTRIVNFKINTFNGADLSYLQGQRYAIEKFIGTAFMDSVIDDLIEGLTPKEEDPEGEGEAING